MTKKELLLEALEEFLRESDIPEEYWATFRVRFKLKAEGMSALGFEVELGPEAPPFPDLIPNPDLKRYFPDDSGS